MSLEQTPAYISAFLATVLHFSGSSHSFSLNPPLTRCPSFSPPAHLMPSCCQDESKSQMCWNWLLDTHHLSSIHFLSLLLVQLSRGDVDGYTWVKSVYHGATEERAIHSKDVRVISRCQSAWCVSQNIGGKKPLKCENKCRTNNQKDLVIEPKASYFSLRNSAKHCTCTIWSIRLIQS